MRPLLCLYAATIAVAVLFALPKAAAAQDRANIFQDYASYSAYVDRTIRSRDFSGLIVQLGGADEYTSEQIAQINQQFLNLYPRDFTNQTVFRQEDLGGGISQEGRMYWIGENYVYYYAILHERGDAFVVINFSLNSNITSIMSRF
ncbi:hypothetical protein [Cognatishimia sp. F0-27]|uniref:hypothetical protein n=1 Tax=Cognatishimia sp. F0-27 TaxID=2816855 RepID=UPI001D0C535F|nr:hypothetical protein [Cognatishimia sp. F0-27]MCC1492674.1 hypothetical protein [Cognatishimia sp. F0-27]